MKTDESAELLLETLDDATAVRVICKLLHKRPAIAMGVVQDVVPDVTYAPTKAFSESRCVGTLSAIHYEQHYGCIDCPDLVQKYGHDVLVMGEQYAGYKVGDVVSFAVFLDQESKPQAFDLQLHQQGDLNQGLEGSMWNDGFQVAAQGISATAFQGVSQGISTNALQGARPGPGGVPVLKPVMVGGSWQLVQKAVASMGGAPGAGPEPGLSGGLGGGGLNSTPHVSALTGFPSAPKSAMEYPGVTDSRHVGTIYSFDQVKNFGFIKCPTLYGVFNRDVFLHRAQLGNFTLGSTVEFGVFLNKNGHPQAKDLLPGSGGGDAGGALADSLDMTAKRARLS